MAIASKGCHDTLGSALVAEIVVRSIIDRRKHIRSAQPATGTGPSGPRTVAGLNPRPLKSAKNAFTAFRISQAPSAD